MDRIRNHPLLFKRTAILAAAVALWSPSVSSGILSQRFGEIGSDGMKYCDPAVPLEPSERRDLLTKLSRTQTGANLIEEYEKLYGTLDTLVVQWDNVSYSQISKIPARVPAATEEQSSKRASVVCVHLAKKLPVIEHLADLAHEMVHASRLSENVLKGEGMSTAEFVRSRIAARGGEADAFSVECAVKKETIGHWDHFCAPYVSNEHVVDQKRVVDDLYSGTLSASLTGEPYPVMLAKQFRRMTERRALNGILK